MNYLVDTHVVLWFIADDKKLPVSIKKMIEEDSSIFFVSMATLWEIAIKYSIGRLDLKVDLDGLFKLIEDSGFHLLPIAPEHILRNANLDFFYQDPFDRLIIAQGIEENLKIISKDQTFEKYPIDLVWS